jgi:hypothetical protein
MHEPMTIGSRVLITVGRHLPDRLLPRPRL